MYKFSANGRIRQGNIFKWVEHFAEILYNDFMRTVFYNQIVSTVEELIGACGKLTPSCKAAMAHAIENENNSNALFALETLAKNAAVAEEYALPVCQDTGMAVFFVSVGQDVHIEGGLLEDAVNEGVRRGYAAHAYRASVLDPVTRINTRDNTPAVVHTYIVEGDKIQIEFLPKGFGSENMSRLYMLTPSQGLDKAKDCIVETAKLAGSNPCPPIVVGVGIGGTAEKAMEIAKLQLLRDVGTPSADETLAEMERDTLARINALGIGAQGFGGNTTAFAVHIGKYPTHISALPVAINIQCNAVRVGKATI